MSEDGPPRKYMVKHELVLDTELSVDQVTAAQVLARLGYKRNGYRRQIGAVLSAAEAVGVNRSTVYNWLRNPIFENEIEKQKQNLWLLAEDCLLWHIKKKTSQSVLAAIYLRKTLDPARGDDAFIRDRQKHELRLLEADHQNKQRDKDLRELDETIVYEIVEHRRDAKKLPGGDE